MLYNLSLAKVGGFEGMARQWIYDMSNIMARRPRTILPHEQMVYDVDFKDVVWC